MLAEVVTVRTNLMLMVIVVIMSDVIIVAESTCELRGGC